MNNATADVLQSALAGVLERYAFVFGDPCENDADVLLDRGRVAVSGEFQGPVSGAMVLSVPLQTAREITSNVLGDGALEKCDDAIKEMLNVLCGQFLLQAYGGDVLFDLGAPGAIQFSGPSDEWNMSSVDVDGELVVALFRANG